MNLRALTIVALASLAFAAVGCAGSADAGASSSEAAVTAGLSNADLQKGLERATKGLEYTSETDAPYDVFVAPGKVGAAIDANAVRTAFNGMPNTHDDDDNLDLKDLPGSEIRDFEDWATSDVDPGTDPDPEQVKYAKGMKQAYDLMRANLTDLKVVLVAAQSMKREEDVGLLQVFVVGRAKDGSLVALHTIAVWT